METVKSNKKEDVQPNKLQFKRVGRFILDGNKILGKGGFGAVLFAIDTENKKVEINDKLKSLLDLDEDQSH